MKVIKGELQIGALGCAYGKGNLKMEKDSLAADGRVIRYRTSGARKGAARLHLYQSVAKRGGAIFQSGADPFLQFKCGLQVYEKVYKVF